MGPEHRYVTPNTFHYMRALQQDCVPEQVKTQPQPPLQIVTPMSFEVAILSLLPFLLFSLKEPLSTLSDPTAAELPLWVWFFQVVALSAPTAWLPLILAFVLLSSPDLLLTLSLG